MCLLRLLMKPRLAMLSSSMEPLLLNTRVEQRRAAKEKMVASC
jgi:hypothetical protein